MKYKENQLTNQEKNKKRLQEVIVELKTSTPLQNEIKNDLFHMSLISARYGNSRSFISQTKRAEKLGTSREYYNRTTHRFARETQLIDINNRGVQQVCWYEIHPMLNDPEVRKQLLPYLPSLKWFSQAFLSVMILSSTLYSKTDNQKYSITPRFSREYKKDCTIDNRSQVVSKFQIVKEMFAKLSLNLQTEKRVVMRERFASEGDGRIASIYEGSPVEAPRLTMVQYALLIAFEKDDIQSAIEAFVKTEGLDDPFLWIFAVCSRHSFYNNMPPNWHLVDSFCEEKGIWQNKIPSLGEIGKQKYEAYIKKLGIPPTPLVRPRSSAPRGTRTFDRNSLAEQQERIASESQETRSRNAQLARDDLIKLFGEGSPLIEKIYTTIESEDIRFTKKE